MSEKFDTTHRWEQFSTCPGLHYLSVNLAELQNLPETVL